MREMRVDADAQTRSTFVVLITSRRGKDVKPAGEGVFVQAVRTALSPDRWPHENRSCAVRPSARLHPT